MPRCQSAELPPPTAGEWRGEVPVPLALVHVREEVSPDGAEPLERFLLTNVAVRSDADAKRMLRWYGLRRRITTGTARSRRAAGWCSFGHRPRERIERAAAQRAVVAWCLAR